MSIKTDAWRKTRYALVSMIAVAGSAILAESPAFAEATTTVTNEVNLHTIVPITNVCTGENLVFDVTYHFLERTTTDGNGGLHYMKLVQGQRVVGTSDDGTEYVGKNMGITNKYEASGTSTFTFVRPLHLVSKGGDGENRLRNINQHFTRTPDGTITVDFFFDRPECNG